MAVRRIRAIEPSLISSPQIWPDQSNAIDNCAGDAASKSRRTDTVRSVIDALEDVTHAFTCGGTVLKSLTDKHIAFLKAMYLQNQG